MSRLKEGERVCGGRGQFDKQPLWDLNTISKLRMEAEAVRSANGIRSESIFMTGDVA
ncbi:MAG: hypothetical protein JO097_13340 [Acidobacteriaceae bacterium]|nr:hypothetical protein [Acidobacteriaceae bacterium]MBV9296336.1 hypothetical protein [Acidobacteriaceae bacterium]MBV9767102.1 hypothetical protein [Acidobacteriaceae bacterium]